jgi:putative membrane protein
MKRFSLHLCCAVATGCLATSGLILAASGSDSKFAMAAAHGGATEVELGKLAAEKGSDPAVKAFGQQMVDDHSKANDQLMSIGQQESMTLPSDMDMKQKTMYAKLKMLSGSAFDKAYVSDMVKDHEEDVKEFTREANSGSDPKIKQFASATLPVIQGHLDKIKAIQAKIGGSAGGM